MAEDYVVADYYILPSKGKIYSPNIDPTIKLRSMTTMEEMKRQSPSRDFPYKTLCDIIDDCTVSDKQMSVYDMCIGDYQYLLHRLRVVTYGPEYNVGTICPYCGNESNDKFSLDDLKILEYSEDFDSLKTVELPESKKTITLKIQTPRMLDTVEQRLKEYRKKAQGQQVDQSILYVMCELIDTIDGVKASPGEKEMWLKNLKMKDMNILYDRANKMNDAIGVDTKLFNTCDFCGLSFYSSLKITSEFFRPSLGT